MNYTRNTPLFFKKKPTSIEAKPNASFLRDMGELHGEKVCEIEYLGNPWIVRYSEISTCEEEMERLREKWTREIKAGMEAALPKTTKVAIAAKLGISTATLRKRMKFCGITPPETSPAPPAPAAPPTPSVSTGEPAGKS